MLIVVDFSSFKQEEKIGKTLSIPQASFRQQLADGPGFDDFIGASDLNNSSEMDKLEENLVSENLQPSVSSSNSTALRMPSWLKTKVPVGPHYHKLKGTLRDLNLHTVCEEARCPNIGDCWGGNKDHVATATIMVIFCLNFSSINELSAL